MLEVLQSKVHQGPSEYHCIVFWNEYILLFLNFTTPPLCVTRTVIDLKLKEESQFHEHPDFLHAQTFSPDANIVGLPCYFSSKKTKKVPSGVLRAFHIKVYETTDSSILAMKS